MTFVHAVVENPCLNLFPLFRCYDEYIIYSFQEVILTSNIMKIDLKRLELASQLQSDDASLASSREEGEIRSRDAGDSVPPSLSFEDRRLREWNWLRQQLPEAAKSVVAAHELIRDVKVAAARGGLDDAF